MAAPDRTDLPTPRSGPPELSFPDVPRLELDELLAQLVDRAHEVMGTQGRLRDLLRASRMVTCELTSATVLERTAEAAGHLVHARYAAVDADGTTGSAAPGGAARAAASRGGERAERLDVPIAVRGEVIATLHLADSESGTFSAADRELVLALAASAGLAVQNARLYEAVRRRSEWLQATAAITRELLGDASGASRPLELVARSMQDVAGADVVAVLRPDDDQLVARHLSADVVLGPGGTALAGEPVPLAGTVLGQVFTEGRAVSLDADGTALGAVPWDGLDVRVVLAVPLAGSGRVHGLLCAGRLRGRPGFSATDREMASGFAGQAAVAVELAQARAEQERAALLDERERIAADLHDTVVQSLFRVGMDLQGVLADLGESRAATRVRATVGDVDQLINGIRSTVFPLDVPAFDTDPRDRVLDAVAELVPALGCEPDLRFAGLLAGTVGTDLVEDVVAVVHAALQDVLRRGRATAASVDVVEDRDGLVVHVRDDAPLGDADAPSEGPRRRAERHGGTFTVTRSSSGTSQYWWVPAR